VARDVRLALTVATVSRASFSRKGIDRFLDAARADPGRPYVLAGRVLADAEDLVADHPTNVTLTGPMQPEKLNELYWSAGIYMQLSWHETFAMAVAEAMVCGCVPVIARQPALLEVAGSWAVVTDGVAGDTDAIRKAEDARIDRDAMRADVASRYAVDLRRAALNRALVGRSDGRLGHHRRRWTSRGTDDLRRDQGDGDQRGDAQRNERTPRRQ
jgi:glycosyltransferase involved in cell wall biosynthesis